MPRELIYKDEAYSAVLHDNPRSAYCINRMKPVEAVEVVHGRWEDDHGDYVCSCCRTVFSDELVWLVRGESSEPNYCPKCGAKMDGGKNDGN